ncbi:hypothetical protein F2Q69_00018374 [Brassica cretica]|uniref:NYN domain-containing protein n=1 Tax=Brassica cretica TaxID=69181 RepID=A0A8S9QEB2_BRACR|nr:hypothetical protein F2Q69_00018374 [Brassica cretica]
MGEDDTIGFESLKQTLVYWNMDDYPIPVDTTDDLDPVFRDILKALDVMGLREGSMRVFLYDEQINREGALVDWTLPESETYGACFYKVPDITWYMIRDSSFYRAGPVNYFVIAKPKRELHRVLHCLQSRRHNVLLVKPPPPDEEFLFSVASLLENARFLGGGKPRFKELYASYALEYDMCFEEYVDIPEDLSKTVDFSERIPTVRGPRTAVFWDAVDCPFPPSSTPDEIYHSISSALVERYFSDNITIWAYLDDDDKKASALLGGDKTWASRIYFLPGGTNDNITIWAYVDERSWRDKCLGNKTWDSRIYFLPAGDRRVRMLNDMYLQCRDAPLHHCPGLLILVSNHFSGDLLYMDLFQNMEHQNYHPFLIIPREHSNISESPDEWPQSLFNRPRKSSQGPLPKKPKLDAA